jgi:hypothetical protein
LRERGIVESAITKNILRISVLDCHYAVSEPNATNEISGELEFTMIFWVAGRVTPRVKFTVSLAGTVASNTNISANVGVVVALKAIRYCAAEVV